MDKRTGTIGGKMSETVMTRLAEIGVELPAPAAPAANYVPWLTSGKTLYISGQLPFLPDGSGECITGKMDGVYMSRGQMAARYCAIQILAQANAALGSLDKITRCLKLGGFVNASEDFSQHPQVINGASDLMVEVFGDAGRHTRFAVGVNSLPFNAMVEIDATFKIRPA
jgi:enamine deaminase RidA (YjgF/YER057c/UK114 family)